MIIGIGGWERCLKTGLGAILATEPEHFNMPGLQEYHIKQGFGNLHLFKTPYPWNHLNSNDLKTFIRKMNTEHTTNTLIFIDEADQVFNPRFFKSQEQIETLQGIGQHAKLGNVIIYTYQLGQPDDTLLGVDKILRSNTRIEFEMRHYDRTNDYAIFKLANRLLPDIPVIESVIPNISRFFSYWDHLEAVV